MEKIQVRILEEIREDTPSDGFAFHANDVRTVDAAVGRKWCALGWAEDVAGVVPTGVRRTSSAELEPADVSTGGS